MAECIECGSYTKFDGGLCKKCYYKQKEGSSIENETAKTNEFDDNLMESGLSEKDKAYRYGMIKGRIAETLIQELFLSLGYNVFHYGMENTIPSIMELLKGVRSDVSLQIRRMPDFVIQNPKTKDVFFAEIKFRASGKFSYSDLPKN